MSTLQELNAGKLKGAKRIKIAAGLKHFPQALFALSDTLEVLDLSDNALHELPDDFGRFHKLKIVFLSNNAFQHLPEVLGHCPDLEMIGFKSNQLCEVSAKALPPKLRWLILTDNQIRQLPDCFDNLPNMQKLMLAGNQLQQLPDSLASCENLQLIRVSANQLKAFPSVLSGLPNLAWCAISGNPFCQELEHDQGLPHMPLADFELQDLLGQGASGRIYLAQELTSAQEKAVKIFKGGVTSDGYPEDEMRACITAGSHPNLVNVEAKVSDAESSGLVMTLIPESYQNLGLPPSLDSCTRDCFADGFVLTSSQLLNLLQQATSALIHLHEQGLVHGDFYAHNVLIDEAHHLLLGDMGAASHLDGLPEAAQQAMMRMEKRALAHFVEDLWLQGKVTPELAEKLTVWHERLLQDQIELVELLQQLGG